MPRAARITGTSEQLAQVISRIEAAIHTTQGLLAAQECPAAAPDGPRRFDTSLQKTVAPDR